MQGVLSYFGIGPYFKSLIDTVYQGSCACVQKNSYFSDWFTVSRGFKQGDFLSCYLFLMVIEVIAIELRADPM